MRLKLLPAVLGAALAFAAIAGAALIARPVHATPTPAGAALESARAAAAVTPQSMADVINARGRAVVSTEFASTGASIGTVPVNAMAAIADVTFDDRIVQGWRVVNTHASQAVCFAPVTRSSSAQSCTAACGGSTITCTGSGAADGLLVQAGGPPQSFPGVGTDCLCAAGAGATTTYNITRVARAANQ